MFHPSFVYTGKFYPERFENTRFMVLSGCFDGRLRVNVIPIHRDSIEPPGIISII